MASIKFVLIATIVLVGLLKVQSEEQPSFRWVKSPRIHDIEGGKSNQDVQKLGGMWYYIGDAYIEGAVLLDTFKYNVTKDEPQELKYRFTYPRGGSSGSYITFGRMWIDQEHDSETEIDMFSGGVYQHSMGVEVKAPNSYFLVVECYLYGLK